MKFALVLLFALVMTAFASHHGHKTHKVVQLSSVPLLKGPVTYNTIPISIWSDGTVVYTTAPAAPENPEELASVTPQVLTGKIDVNELADFLLFAVDNEYVNLENKYEDKTKEPNAASTCMTIFDKHGATESCELNDNVAPKLFTDLVCKIRALVASAQETKPFVPESAYIRAYSISKKGVASASLWGGKQLLVDAEKGVWFHKKDAAVAFEAAVQGTVFDYQGQYVHLTAQVHGISLVEPSTKADQVEAQNAVNITKLHIVMIVMMALVLAFVIAAVVFFAVRMCGKLIKAYESDEHLVDEEEGRRSRDEDSYEEESVNEEERPFLSVHTEEPVATQQAVPADTEPVQYFYMIPQNQMVFPNNEQYVLPPNFGPFPQALTFNP
jgi:hypothetical protein